MTIGFLTGALAVAALTGLGAPAPADAHDCSGFDGTCGAQFHTDTVISGGKQTGDVVTCAAGQAHAAPGEPTYTGRFQRGSTPIPGTDFNGPSASYTLTEADVGFYVVCITEARHPEGDSASTSSGWHGPITLRRRCADVQRGTRGDDTLLGTAAEDRLLGLVGDDVLRGRGGDDCLQGGPGRDRIDGGSGDDRISGGSGYDSIVAGPGDDHISAADGDVDSISCGTGRDTVRADRGDMLSGCERERRVR